MQQTFYFLKNITVESEIAAAADGDLSKRPYYRYYRKQGKLRAISILQIARTAATVPYCKEALCNFFNEKPIKFTFSKAKNAYLGPIFKGDIDFL